MSQMEIVRYVVGRGLALGMGVSLILTIVSITAVAHTVGYHTVAGIQATAFAAATVGAATGVASSAWLLLRPR